MKTILKIFRYSGFEAIVWIAGLLALATVDPNAPGHFSICIPSKLGIDFCPGCGLGRSMALLYDGQIAESFRMHPLGIPVVFILCCRIYTLIKNSITKYKLTEGGLNGRNL